MKMGRGLSDWRYFTASTASASVLAGALALQSQDGHLEHFERLGYVVAGAALVSLFFMYRIHKAVPEKTA